MPNVVAPFMPPPNGFGLSHPMQLAAAAFLHPLMPTQRPPTFTPSNNFCPPNSSPFTSPAQLHFMQQLMAAAVQQQQQLPLPPPPPLPPTNLQTQQQLPPNFLPSVSFFLFCRISILKCGKGGDRLYLPPNSQLKNIVEIKVYL